MLWLGSLFSHLLPKTLDVFVELPKLWLSYPKMLDNKDTLLIGMLSSLNKVMEVKPLIVSDT